MALTIELNLQEENIIHACIRNESWAQRHLYEEHYSFLMSICIRYASNREEAKDWLQDCFLKIFLHIHQYQIGTSLKSWMYRLTVNQCVDQIRKQSRMQWEDPAYFPEYGAEPEILAQLEAEEILNGIQHMSVRYRAVFNLFVIEGLTHAEIAKELGINESTSRANLAKARAQLRQFILKHKV